MTAPQPPATQQPGWGATPPGYYYGSPPPPPPPSRGNPLAIVAGFVGVLMLVAVVVAVIVLVSQPPPPVAPCQPGVPCSPPASLRPISGASPGFQTPGPIGTTRPISTPAPVATATPAPIQPTPTPAPGQTPPPATNPPIATPGATPFQPPTAPPTSDSPPALSGEVWDSDTLGFSFEYNPGQWQLSQNSTEEVAILNGLGFDAQILVEAVPATTGVAELIQKELGRTERLIIGRAVDGDEYDALLGPSIGYLRGEGSVYSGTLVGQDGTPVEPAGITVLASTDGRITVAVLILVGSPDVRIGGETHQHLVRSSADLILKTFDWDTST